MVSVIGFKFFAALQFGGRNVPENLDKFIICQVPAYTEDEDSLRRAIDSAARMRYDDKRKLLIVVCDGGVLVADDIEAIVLQEGELAGYAFVRPDQAPGRVTPLVARRISACLEALATGTVASLEGGSPAG